MPLSASLDTAEISAAAWKSRCVGTAGCQRQPLHSVQSCLSLNPQSTFLCPLPRVGKHHHPHTVPVLPYSPVLAAKSAPFSNSPREGLADRLAWGLVFRTSVSTECPFGILMCLQGYLLLGNCQLKFEPDLGIAVNCLG